MPSKQKHSKRKHKKDQENITFLSSITSKKVFINRYKRKNQIEVFRNFSVVVHDQINYPQLKLFRQVYRY